MKKIIKIFKLFINALAHPSHISLIFRDLSNRLTKTQSDSIHLKAAIDWLKHSQDITNTGGCAGVYTFESGWTGPYPETTGYIIPTFINYGELMDDPEYLERAKRMGDWEISIQLASGAVRGGIGINEYPIVFNTGQVMLGWVALYNKTKIEKYKDAAIKASEWLVSNLDDDGKWSKNTFNNVPHAYNVRVTWALLDVAKLTGNNVFYEAAIKNVKWVLNQSKDNAWFDYMGFSLNEQPLTHTIAYTLRGLLECSFLIDEKELKEQIVQKVNQTSELIMKKHEAIAGSTGSATRGFLPGTFNSNWISEDKYSCLTGDAQMAIIWMKLYKLNGNAEFLNAAIQNIEQIKSTQHLSSKNKGIRGGISGSYPIWGKYTNFGYPNWAAKFFADAITLKNTVTPENNK
jgi:hypothetical protein